MIRRRGAFGGLMWVLATGRKVPCNIMHISYAFFTYSKVLTRKYINWLRVEAGVACETAIPDSEAKRYFS